MRAAVLALLLAAPAPGAAQAQECRLALVLALDVSSSVDAREDRLQREGLAKALTAPLVRDAFLLPPDPVALHVFEWSGRNAQVPILGGWEVVETEDDLRSIATAVAKSRRSTSEFPTALGAALGHAAVRLRDAPDCRARTVDVSGDGINNEGFTPATAYGTFPFEGVTVNALAIAGAEDGGELVDFFRREVLRGEGAFLIEAAGYADYARAMEAKLLRELMAPMVSSLPQGPAG
jgi:hypothetical protein